MLRVIDENEINVQVSEDHIRDLAIDPPHGVLDKSRAISLYSLRVDKWTFTIASCQP